MEGLGRLIHLAPALYESLGLPYTGAGSEAMYLTSNKPLAKRLLAAAGIATPEGVEPATQGLSAPDLRRALHREVGVGARLDRHRRELGGG